MYASELLVDRLSVYRKVDGKMRVVELSWLDVKAKQCFEMLYDNAVQKQWIRAESEEVVALEGD